MMWPSVISARSVTSSPLMSANGSATRNITFLPVFLMPVLGNLGFANTTFSDADFCIVGTILGNVINMIK